ncbi:unnamed protein product, partial [Schistosoma margrebowiei]
MELCPFIDKIDAMKTFICVNYEFLVKYPNSFCELAINQDSSEWIHMLGLSLLYFNDFSIQRHLDMNNSQILFRVNSPKCTLIKPMQRNMTYKPIVTSNGSMDVPTSVEMNSPAKLLVYGTRCGTITFVELSTMRELWSLTGHRSSVQSLCFLDVFAGKHKNIKSPEKFISELQLMSASEDGDVYIWDASTVIHNVESKVHDKTVISQLASLCGYHRRCVTTSAWHPRRRLVATGDLDCMVYLWDVSEIDVKFSDLSTSVCPVKLHPFKSINVSSYPIISIAFRLPSVLSNEQEDLVHDDLAIGCWDGTIHFYNLSSLSIVRSLSASTSICSLAYSPNGGNILATFDKNGVLMLWNDDILWYQGGLIQEYSCFTNEYFPDDQTDQLIPNQYGKICFSKPNGQYIFQSGGGQFLNNYINIWDTGLWATFAFVSVNRTTLWKRLRHYEVPKEIVNIIQNSYDGLNCKILHGAELTKSFEVKIGIRQGCLLSPFLFLLVIDWITKTSTSEGKHGIQWTSRMQLDDLDFADDLALLSQTQQQMQEKTTSVASVSAAVDLNIREGKSKILRYNTACTNPITIDGEDLEDVKTFAYLSSIIDEQWIWCGCEGAEWQSKNSISTTEEHPKLKTAVNNHQGPWIDIKPPQIGSGNLICVTCMTKLPTYEHALIGWSNGDLTVIRVFDGRLIHYLKAATEDNSSIQCITSSCARSFSAFNAYHIIVGYASGAVRIFLCILRPKISPHKDRYVYQSANAMSEFQFQLIDTLWSHCINHNVNGGVRENEGTLCVASDFCVAVTGGGNAETWVHFIGRQTGSKIKKSVCLKEHNSAVIAVSMDSKFFATASKSRQLALYKFDPLERTVTLWHLINDVGTATITSFYLLRRFLGVDTISISVYIGDSNNLLHNYAIIDKKFQLKQTVDANKSPIKFMERVSNHLLAASDDGEVSVWKHDKHSALQFSHRLNVCMDMPSKSNSNNSTLEESYYLTGFFTFLDRYDSMKFERTLYNPTIETIDKLMISKADNQHTESDDDQVKDPDSEVTSLSGCCMSNSNSYVT